MAQNATKEELLKCIRDEQDRPTVRKVHLSSVSILLDADTNTICHDQVSSAFCNVQRRSAAAAKSLVHKDITGRLGKPFV